jgi:hypothetical protein
MAKDAKEKAVYAPGELGRIRERLGPIDENEAKRMAGLLGGEVGVERKETADRDPKAAQKAGAKKKGGSQPLRRVETVADAGDQGLGLLKKDAQKKKLAPEDDPAVPFRVSYLERIKMDRYAAQPEFEIKSFFQVFDAISSIFRKDSDLVNATFVNRRIDEYYKKIETLVVSTRTLFPRNNLKYTEQLKKMSPFMYSILNTIRYWNIERIASDIARMQSHPRHVRVNSFAEILRAVYKPLFILERLDLDVHIKGAYKLLYKILYIDNPMDAKDKYQELIRSALASYETIRKEVHYLLYPLLMKLLSDRWLPYQRFFLERKNRLMAFLNVTEADCIAPESMNQRNEQDISEESQRENATEADQPEENTPEAAAKQAVNDLERKAVERGLRTLESLFPQAGWDKLDTFPDLYTYFAKVLNLKKGYELIAPTDPLFQVVILMLILEELFFGLRYVSFGSINSNTNAEALDDHTFLEAIIDNWHNYEINFSQEYLSRLIEYCQLLESSTESRTSNYAKRLYMELQWIKRLCFLPHYRFETLITSPIKKSNITPLYPEIRKLRKCLTTIAASIEEANRQGGVEKQVTCEGIKNPWASYNFQIANPLSMRLNALLGPTKRNNATLVFFTLSVVTVLDYLVNNEDSWAYENNSSPLFRSIDGEGSTPQFGVDEKLDADMIFRQVMKTRQKGKEAKAPAESPRAGSSS